MNIIHLLFIFHKRNVKFCFVKKKYKKILAVLIIFHKFATKYFSNGIEKKKTS